MSETPLQPDPSLAAKASAEPRSQTVLPLPGAVVEILRAPVENGAPQRVIGLPPEPPEPAQHAAGQAHKALRRTSGGWRRFLNRPGPASLAASLIVHACLLPALALLLVAPSAAWSAKELLAAIDITAPLPLLISDDRSLVYIETDEPPGALEQVGRGADAGAALQAGGGFRGPALVRPLDPDAVALAVGRRDPAATADLLQASDMDVRDGLTGRQGYQRQALVQTSGGTRETEIAVQRGLRWLRAHQYLDGSWHFDQQAGPCSGYCRNPGTEPSVTAATALALLPFLGAGHTHAATGEYQDTIYKGLYFLQKQARLTEHGVDFQKRTLYDQALCAIVFCESYALTNDRQLQNVAQKAIDFIAWAQEKKGGGWRYGPGDPGDLTVSGWQIMALKSGQMAHLNVPRPTIYRAQHFLDTVQSDGGSQYGYQPGYKPSQTCTSIGLLSRMYTGWRRNKPALYQGVKYLMQWGPSPDDMYYNYYATQVLHHWEGPDWDTWNRKMRELLLRTQAAAGPPHEAGSWHASGGKGDVGGRLYNTAMAILTLEVYYRHLPLYSAEANREF